MKVCCIYIFSHKKESFGKEPLTIHHHPPSGEKKVRLRHKKHESRVRGSLKPVVLDASLHVPNIASLLCSYELGYGPLNTTSVSQHRGSHLTYLWSLLCMVDRPLSLALDSIGLFFYFRGWQTFTVKGQTINILGFVSYMVSVTMARLCPCRQP